MIDLLFVYGTLMSSAGGALGRAERGRLANEARRLGPATTRGLLYDLGRYPGLVASDDPAHVVHGEVLRLRDPAASLRWLDLYEGIVPGRRALQSYDRVERAARMAGGQTLRAWVYVYTRDVARARLLADGCWAEHRAAPRRSQR